MLLHLPYLKNSHKLFETSTDVHVLIKIIILSLFEVVVIQDRKCNVDVHKFTYIQFNINNATNIDQTILSIDLQIVQRSNEFPFEIE